MKSSKIPAFLVAFLAVVLVTYSQEPAPQAPQEPAQPEAAAASLVQQAPSKPPCLGKFSS